MDKRFLNIPIPLLRELYINSRNFFNSVIDVGIYLYSKTLTGSKETRFRAASKFLGIRHHNIVIGIMNAENILRRLPARYPVAGIETEMLFSFYKYPKKEFDLLCLGAFLAIKSIIGTKPYDKTNKAMIHARMFGYLSSKELPERLTELERKMQHRRQMDKVLRELQLNWHLRLLWNHNRGFYVSFDMSLDQLAAISETAKKKAKLAEIQRLKQLAIKKARDAICTT